MRADIEEAIRQNCHADVRELALVEPQIPCAQVRPIYMVKGLYERIYGPRAEDSKRMGHLDADLRRFISGDKITIARGEEESCNLKPLSNVDEVWELRSRDPKPSIRVFGRFADKDVFIATNMEHRKKLFALRSRAWAVEIRTCQTAWNRLFPHLDPHRGETSHDYVSNAIDLDCDVPE